MGAAFASAVSAGVALFCGAAMSADAALFCGAGVAVGEDWGRGRRLSRKPKIDCELIVLAGAGVGVSVGVAVGAGVGVGVGLGTEVVVSSVEVGKAADLKLSNGTYAAIRVSPMAIRPPIIQPTKRRRTMKVEMGRRRFLRPLSAAAGRAAVA